MTNRYAEILEKIVDHMKTTISQNDKAVSQDDYLLWLDFLKKVYPESFLLRNTMISVPSHNVTDYEFGKKIKLLSDIGEIMVLAEEKQYPTWFIQPKFIDQPTVLEYNQGRLEGVGYNISIPKIIEVFTGKISGYMQDKKFIVIDTDMEINFLKKMQYLEKLKLTTPEYVLFPTDRMAKISISKLLVLFQNYVSQAQSNGLKVDGIVIVSDSPLFEADQETNSRRIALAVS